MVEETKQVIVVRTDLKMPVGKIAAQVSHASLAFITKNERLYHCDLTTYQGLPLKQFIKYFSGEFADEVDRWMTSDFTKVCVRVDSEEELLDLHRQAQELKLESHLIIDNGKTCFNNVKTPTCLGLGPHYLSKFELTKHLKLL